MEYHSLIRLLCTACFARAPRCAPLRSIACSLAHLPAPELLGWHMFMNWTRRFYVISNHSAVHCLYSLERTVCEKQLLAINFLQNSDQTINPSSGKGLQWATVQLDWALRKWTKHKCNIPLSNTNWTLNNYTQSLFNRITIYFLIIWYDKLAKCKPNNSGQCLLNWLTTPLFALPGNFCFLLSSKDVYLVSGLLCSFEFRQTYLSVAWGTFFSIFMWMP